MTRKVSLESIARAMRSNKASHTLLIIGGIDDIKNWFSIYMKCYEGETTYQSKIRA